jgi:hypothetical protein
MTFLKNKYRSRLIADDHSENTLHVIFSSRVPDFKKLAQEKKCNFFH